MTAGSTAGARAAAIDRDAVFTVVEDGVARSMPGGPRVLGLTWRPSPYGSTSVLEELDVTLADGRVLPLMFKDLGATAAPGRVRPGAVADPAREIAVYQGVLGHHDLGTPRCVAAVADPVPPRYWLITERVAGLQLCHVGEFDVWLAAARWLARMHVRLQGAATPSPLPLVDAARYRVWIDRLMPGDAGPLPREAAARLSSRARRAALELCAEAPTITHGEFFPANILVRDDGRRSICVVDWETVAVGSGLVDLASLASGWDARARRALAEAYAGARAALGAPSMDLDRTLRLLDCARLLVAVRMLGWPRDWRPPSPHARDWAADALEAAADVDLSS